MNLIKKKDLVLSFFKRTTKTNLDIYSTLFFLLFWANTCKIVHIHTIILIIRMIVVVDLAIMWDYGIFFFFVCRCCFVFSYPKNTNVIIFRAYTRNKKTLHDYIHIYTYIYYFILIFLHKPLFFTSYALLSHQAF